MTHTQQSFIDHIHHVEMYVANCSQSAYFFGNAFGFQTATGSYTRAPDRISIAMQRGEIRLLLTSPMTADSEVMNHIRLHGDGIKDIALTVVGSPEDMFRAACQNGARPVRLPAAADYANGVAPCIGVCGSLVHSLFRADVAPSRWQALTESPGASRPAAVDAVDHVALALEQGELETWAAFYANALGFSETHREDVATEYSGMRSRVVSSGNGRVCFPMMEAAEGLRESQIDRFVAAHHGAGAQHLALRSSDIVASVAAASTGMEFLAVPPGYYDGVESRLGAPCPDLDRLRAHGILVDRDRDGVLLQTFSRPLGPRPTLFVELIERRGATGFGSGNIRALFEAVERAQTQA